MIKIFDTTYDVSDIISQYLTDSIQRQLLATMSESTEIYQYDSVDQLIFEITLRKETAEAAELLNKSRFAFAVFYQSRCNPIYWDRTQNGGFRLKWGAKPADAINNIYIDGELYATECATAMLIVYYKALIQVYGEEQFNNTFTNIYLMNWHNIETLFREVGNPVHVHDILIGDRCYIINPDVSPQYPECQGENVIVLGNGLYYGHGLGITTVNNIIAELNTKRRYNSTKSAYFIESTAARPDFKNLANIYLRSASIST